MKKRLLCLVLAALMVMSCVLAGCSSKTAEPAETPSTSTSEPAKETTTPAEEEPAPSTEEPQPEQKTIQIMITGPGKQTGSDAAWAAFNDVLQKYVPNTTVEFIEAPFSEYSEKFTQVLASGEGVDLGWLAGQQAPEHCRRQPDAPERSAGRIWSGYR